MKNNKEITILMYHYVRDLKNSRYPRIKGLDIKLFKEQIKFLEKHYYFVTVEQVIESYANNEHLPSHSVLLTFDDAYADHFTNVFPILKREHIQGAFYPPVKAITEHLVLDVNKIHFILASTPQDQLQKLINEIKQQLKKYKEEYRLKSFEYYFEKLAVANRFDPKEVIFVKRLLQLELNEKLRNILTNSLFERIVGIEENVFSRELYMSIDQLKCMVDCGMHVGSHGYNHHWLGSLTKEKQSFEISKSLEFIEEIGGDINNWTMCYPYGSFNDDTITLLRENGCRMGFTTEVALANNYSTDPDSIYKLPRIDTNDLPKDSKSEVNKWYR